MFFFSSLLVHNKYVFADGHVSGTGYTPTGLLYAKSVGWGWLWVRQHRSRNRLSACGTHTCQSHLTPFSFFCRKYHVLVDVAGNGKGLERAATRRSRTSSEIPCKFPGNSAKRLRY